VFLRLYILEAKTRLYASDLRLAKVRGLRAVRQRTELLTDYQ